MEMTDIPPEIRSYQKVERMFEESGLKCFTKTVDTGHRCGYVMVEKGHPLYGCKCSVDERFGAIEVDGGVTFAETFGDVTVLGWDAGHWWHLVDPSIKERDFTEDEAAIVELYEALSNLADTLGGFDPEKYMVDADIAEEETRRLARQLAEMEEVTE
jgi:hypothetical protein